MEGRVEQLSGTLEQIQSMVSENQAETTKKFEALGIQVTHLSKNDEDLKLGVGELMKFINANKETDLEKESSVIINPR